MSHSSTATRLVAAIRAGLTSSGDAERAKTQQAYLKSTLPCLGVPNPTVRLIVRTLLAEEPGLTRAEWIETFQELWIRAEHHEDCLAAIEVASVKRHWAAADLMPIYRQMVVSGTWWDLIDPIASPLVAEVLRHQPEVGATIRSWAGSEDPWLRRVAIICQRSFGTTTDTDLLAEAIEANLFASRFGTGFFIRKAIGWALRSYARTDPGWVRDFVATHDEELSTLSKREALRNLD